MVDEEESSGGKIDWTIAIVLSVAFHAAVLGSVWMFSDKPGDKAADVPAGEVDRAKPAEATAEPAETAGDIATPVSTTPVSTTPVDTTPTLPSGTSGTATDEPKFGTYVVKSGDFLSRIANKCNCTVAELKKLNDIKDPNSLRPGQKLKIPVQE